ncbi:MAG: type I 3-dehydroquinate dehydratase [Thermoplasmata archaeon]
MSRIPQLVVTLTSRRLEEARAELEEVARAGADLAEIRLDLWEESERPRARELPAGPLPLLLTVRSRAEGGEGPDDPMDRERLRHSVAGPNWAALDLEAARDLLPRAGGMGGRATLWVSTHLPPEATGAGLDQELDRPIPPGAIRKVVVPASLSLGLNDTFYRAQKAAQSGITLLTTGPAGPLERAWAQRLGIPYVFAAPPERTPTHAGRRVEPSQLPVDRLHRYFAADPPAPLLAVVGRPVHHSWSPWIHHHWMDADRRAGLYLALEPASAGELTHMLPRLAEGGFRGLNVTAPFKEAAQEAATRLHRTAETVGSANTLTFEGSRIRADNTDLVAIHRRLTELRDSAVWNGEQLVVAGTGGAARSAVVAGRDFGARVAVWGRRDEAADRLAQEFGVERWRPGPRSASPLVIHATPVGRGSPGEALPIEEMLAPSGHLIDFVYAATDRILRNAAAARKATYESGLRLLLYQAAASYEIWWGTAPTPALVESTFREVEPCEA